MRNRQRRLLDEPGHQSRQSEDDYFGVDSIEAMDAIEKVNRELGFNDSVAQEMQQTRSIDGRQSASNDDYEITWSYHPDNGLEVLYKLK